MKDYQLDLILNRDLQMACEIAQTKKEWGRYFEVFSHSCEHANFQGVALSEDYVLDVLKKSNKFCYSNSSKTWFCPISRESVSHPIALVDFYILYGADALESLIERGMFEPSSR